MTRTHRTLDGDWAGCEDHACSLLFHFDDLTVAEAKLLPMHVLLPLLEIMDPPTRTANKGTYRLWKNSAGKYHRDYDLPAEIWTDGTLQWYQHGSTHRDHDRPAVMYKGGRLDWLQDGRLHREGGKPAVVLPDGSVEYWLNGIEVEAPA